MIIDQRVEEVLRETRVVEFGTINRDGGVSNRPLSSTWLPDSGQVLLTTPAAYPQKVREVRRDGRVALLYSDRTDSGLPDGPAFLVQGSASAPPGVAGAADMEAFWRTVFERHPQAVDAFADEHYRQTMDWYYWRLPIYVTPERITELPASPAGGVPASIEPADTSLSAQLGDALTRYPTAVLASRDADGAPYAVRALVEATDGARRERLAVRPVGTFEGLTGPASLLWHRHHVDQGDIETLSVLGTLESGADEYTFTPRRIPGAPQDGQPAGGDGDWMAAGRTKALRFLEREGLTPPEIDWELLRSYAAF